MSIFKGLPKEWENTSALACRDSTITHETTLPVLSFSTALEPIINFEPSPLSRSGSPDPCLIEDDESEAIILAARLATRHTTQRLLHTKPEMQPLKIIIDDSLVQHAITPGLSTASEGMWLRPHGSIQCLYTSLDSPSTPLLTPDTTPMTPFRGPCPPLLLPSSLDLYSKQSRHTATEKRTPKIF